MKIFVIMLFGLLVACSEDNSLTIDGAGSDPAPSDIDPNTDYPSLIGTGITWKPVSEGDSKLVILLPSSSACVSVFVGSEQGAFIGRTNPNRCTYRFNRAGGGYLNGVTLTVGGNRYTIKSTSVRKN